ncbi:CPBP family intramembrane glutamic endopeptidase [Terriglobus aquaticus]|uniref:Lysostaphin resistance A-like protein n=1 Tax=Terriglobus aquaticus TaxID=940139 RepID=A0ABW9KNQ8_9BACT|nr:CPBP family intramembrane glutamic endopeptidase [Terriglobus aquaticus]
MIFRSAGPDSVAEPHAWDDPSASPQPPRLPRQPHAGSTLLVLTLLGLSMALVSFVAIYGFRRLHHIQQSDIGAYSHPLLSIAIEFFAYALTAAAAYPLLRALWQRPVGSVLEMNWARARPVSPILVASGLCLAVAAQLAAARMSLPKNMPIDNFFHSSRDIWFMAIFGTLFAPIAEEILFRGFLLKTFAIAFDWTRQYFGDAESAFWRDTDQTSTPAWIFGAVISSALFAGMHAAQLGKAWNAVAVLSLVGLILSAVRIRMRSVWASSLLHMGYNGLLFVMVFFATDGFRHLDKLSR